MTDELVTVGTYQTPEEAHVVRLKLEGHGLLVFIEDENYQLTDNPGWPADGVKVKVPRDESARARIVLRGPASPPSR